MQYQKEEVRERILEAALAEFERSGYYRASMRKIAVGSKVPIGNLYRYFASKEALFDAVVKEASEAIPRFIAKSYEHFLTFDVSDLRRLAEEISVAISDIADRYGREFLILIDKSEGSAYAQFYNGIRMRLEEMFLFGIFPRPTKGNRMLAKTIADGFLTGLLTFWRETRGEERRQLIHRLAKFYFNGAESRI